MRGKTVIRHLDDSDVATILAALRLFQQTYDGYDALQIAEFWPDHFYVRRGRRPSDEPTIEPAPLGTADIEDLCKVITTTKVLVTP